MYRVWSDDILIVLKKLNDKEIVLNCDCIEIIEETPDTTITLTNGHKIVVKDEVDDIIDKILKFKRSTYR